MELAIPKMLLEMKDDDIISKDEYIYWKGYENRTFYIDYDTDDECGVQEILDLGKTIILMNMEEMNIPKEELKPIYIWLHSYGGDLDSGLYLCDLIHSSRIPIVTIAMGVAMSCGSLLFMAGHKRYAFPHSQILIHSGSAGFSGTAEQMEEFQKNYKKTLNQMKEYILKYTNIDEKTFNKNRNKDWYLTSEELIKYNVADKLIDRFEDIFE